MARCPGAAPVIAAKSLRLSRVGGFIPLVPCITTVNGMFTILVHDRPMASILLHDASSGDKMQVNTDRILYAVPGQPYGHAGSRVYMDNERFMLDVRETPEEIHSAVNRALLRIHAPDSQTLKNKAREEMRKAFEARESKLSGGNKSPIP